LDIPIQLAAVNGNEDVVKLLLEHGANPDTHDWIRSSLHEAAGYRQKKIAKPLLEHDADFDAKTQYSETALHRAATKGHKEVVQLLLKHGATVDTKTQDSETAHHRAAANGHIEVVQLLLDYDATVNQGDDHLKNALYKAAINGYSEIVSQLLSRRANVDLKYEDGKTLLAELSEIGDIGMVYLLLDHGANIEALDNSGQTPAKDRSIGVEQLIEMAERQETQNSAPLKLAIVHYIRSIMLLETYGKDLQTGGAGRHIERRHRLQCCQIEEKEFTR
jgi:ankyrin repeat protein